MSQLFWVAFENPLVVDESVLSSLPESAKLSSHVWISFSCHLQARKLMVVASWKEEIRKESFFQRESEKHVCTIYICMETWQNGTKALCIIIHKIMKKLNNFKYNKILSVGPE